MLSTVLAPSGITRDCPRPPGLRNARFAEQFDWDTVFYDVYRVGAQVLFQGPPLFNFAAMLRNSRMFRPRWLPRTRWVERNRASELWLRTDANVVALDGPLGPQTITVQPNLSHELAGRRVLHTLSKDNEIRWIIDWIAFYVAEHGADAVLFYDNGSTIYNTDELRRRLEEAFSAMPVIVVDWPFRYGPQGGMAGAVDGQEAPWDSDYCQTGSMQHARFRYCLSARSVLNVDIDELVLSDRGRSIFAATEENRTGFIKFAGRWITTATPLPVPHADCRHADFLFRETGTGDDCPPKWCLAPARVHWRKHTWSVHNLFGAKANRTISNEFVYRHMKGISNSWKEARNDVSALDPERHVMDEALQHALRRAGLTRG